MDTNHWICKVNYLERFEMWKNWEYEMERFETMLENIGQEVTKERKRMTVINVTKEGAS